MSSRRWPRFAAATAVLLAMLGAWLAHTLEFLRLTSLTGVAPVGASPFGAVHAYMLPTLGFLLAMGVLAGRSLWRLWWRLAARLQSARARLPLLLHSGSPSSQPQVGVIPSTPTLPSSPVRLLCLWLPLWLAQLTIYITQENVEAGLAGHALPGFGAVLGIHGAALLIHAAVALFIAAGILVAAWPFRTVARRLERVQRLLALLWHSRRAATANASGIVPRRVHPRDHLGSALWQRPPPAALPS